jgi:hypothetical protein
MKESLPPTQEAQAQELAAAIAQAAHEDLLRIARDLVRCDDASLFGDTEFRVRDAILGVAAKAYEQRLAQKKRLPGSQRKLPALRPRRCLPR